MDENLTDVLADIGEAALDAVTENEVIREIPILGTAVGIARAASSIRDRVFLNKVRHFLKNVDEIGEDQRARFQETLGSNPEARSKTGEAVFYIFEQGDSMKKVEYAALAFRAFLDGQLPYDELSIMCYAIRQAYTGDLECFVESEQIASSKYNLRFLVPSGLAEASYQFVSAGGSLEPDYDVSDTGKALRDIWIRYRGVEQRP